VPPIFILSQDPFGGKEKGGGKDKGENLVAGLVPYLGIEREGGRETHSRSERGGADALNWRQKSTGGKEREGDL